MSFEIKDLKKLRALSSEKLSEELKAASQELYSLEQKLMGGELKNTSSVKPLRRHIAAIRTIQKAQ